MIVLQCPSPRSRITLAVWVISPLVFIVPSALWVTISELTQVVRNLFISMNSESIMEAVQPLSMRAVTMVVQSEVGFWRLTLTSREEVPCQPCIVTILKSSFGQDTESEFILAVENTGRDSGGEAAFITPCLRENPPSWPSVFLAPSWSHPPYPRAEPPGPQAHQWLLWMSDCGIWGWTWGRGQFQAICPGC